MKLLLRRTLLVSTFLSLPGVIQGTGNAFAEPSRYALVVGVKEYPASDKLPNLTYTERDALKLSETLTGGGYQSILMTQTAAQGAGNQRFSPTAAFVRRQFDGLVGTPFLNKQDCLLVVLNGHGIQLPSRKDPAAKTFYFCPADAAIDGLQFSEDVDKGHNLIAVEELYTTLRKSAAGVKLLVVDACRNDPNRPDFFKSADSATRPPVPVPPGGIAAFFSCSSGQRAMEDQTLNHGVFSHFLIEGLTGKADTDSDRLVTVSELQTFVGKRTYDYVFKTYSRKQLPDLKGDIKGFAPLLSIPEDNFAGTKAGQLWDKNGLAMKFRWCPPGTFTMGSPESEPEHSVSENQVEVTLTKGFWLGQYEVTQGEYEKLMGNNPSEFKGKSDSATRPVEQVDWDEAMEFCEKLTEQERAAGRLPVGWEFTLPTEAQWEYACRAGTTTATAFGNTLSSTQANFDGEFPYNGAATGPTKAESVSVGSYQPNAWNLYDMHGNVWEWCRDYFAQKLPGGRDPYFDRPRLPLMNSSLARGLRGGCWEYHGRLCRSACRSHSSPELGINILGFRVALVQSQPKSATNSSGNVVPKINQFAGNKAGDLWDKNGLAMKFRWCPSGTFMMGSPESEAERQGDEDQVKVTLTRGFWLGQYEVTQGEWEKLMGTDVDEQRQKEGYSGESKAGKGATHPMYYVSWAEVMEFCNKLTEQERKAGRLPIDWAYTLPTEAQWEYACRAGTTTATAFGNTLSSSQANFDGDSPYNGAAKSSSTGKTATVGNYKPNAWNLSDMHGNVWEWCLDWYVDPLPGGTDPLVTRQSRGRVWRGGGYFSNGGDCRSAMRDGAPGGRFGNIGFRVALVQTGK